MLEKNNHRKIIWYIKGGKLVISIVVGDPNFISNLIYKFTKKTRIHTEAQLWLPQWGSITGDKYVCGFFVCASLHYQNCPARTVY